MKGKTLFTPEELAEMAAFDAEVDAAPLTIDELRETRERDKAAAYANKPRKEQKIAEQWRRYYEANKEKIAEQRRRYYEANKEKIADYQRGYYEANKEKIAEQRRARLALRAGNGAITC